MKAVEKNMDFLCLFSKTSRKQRRALLQTMSKLQLRAFLEVIFNVLKGTVDISASFKNSLEGYKHIIRQVIDRKVSTKKKIKLILHHTEIL